MKRTRNPITRNALFDALEEFFRLAFEFGGLSGALYLEKFQKLKAVYFRLVCSRSKLENIDFIRSLYIPLRLKYRSELQKTRVYTPEQKSRYSKAKALKIKTRGYRGTPEQEERWKANHNAWHRNHYKHVLKIRAKLKDFPRNDYDSLIN